MALDPSTLAGGVMAADGGWSTQLQLRGVPTDVAAEVARKSATAPTEDLPKAADVASRPNDNVRR